MSRQPPHRPARYRASNGVISVPDDLHVVNQTFILILGQLSAHERFGALRRRNFDLAE